ncbi:MAG: GGDEF domain-containing protein [Clostridium sp.]|uniref:GGDEF domain-containing protein n=1 Tax=Clostridium sp. TaxID=1506 RepID=UPI0025B94732|nr:GGDEF domain-containing protein [Clostridium sp.]MCE5220266.1 GGDEF domain-containing protein [Clostridium sp.]
MKKISFRNVILAITFSVYFIFSFLLFIYFNNIYYENIKEKLVAENSFSARSVEQLLNAQKDILAQEASFAVNYPAVYFAFVDNKYVNFYWNKPHDINSLNLENMSSYKYTEISYGLSRVIGKNIGDADISNLNIALFDKEATPLSNVPGIDDNFKDTGKENYIKYMLTENNKYSNIQPVGTIASKDNKLYFKGIDRVYSSETMGVAVVTLQLKESMLKNIESVVNKKIVILVNDEVQLSTMEMEKNTFDASKPTFNQGNEFFEVFKINGRDMGYSFFPIKDFNNNVIAYAGVGFDMKTVKDNYITNMSKFVPVEIFSSLMLFIMLFIITKKIFNTFKKIIEITEEINKGNYYLETKDSRILELSIIMKSISKMSEAIKHREEDLVRLSTIDELTGIYNKSKINDILRTEIKTLKRYDSEFSIIMVDIDHFKTVNDNFGHDVGDVVLKEVASALKNNIRQTDFIGRWGGEEFIIICTTTSLEEATKLANKIREKIEVYRYSVTSNQTVSLGVATLILGEDSKSLFTRVDKALYNAKKLGRNRVEVSNNRDI